MLKQKQGINIESSNNFSESQWMRFHLKLDNWILVKLGCLADYNGAGANHQYFFNLWISGHYFFTSIIFIKRSNSINYRNSQTISEYKILEAPDIDLGKIGVQKLENMTIEVIDPIKDYVEMLEGIFDFEALKKLFKSGFTMKFDAMNAVTGPYGKRIFEEILGAAPGSVINAVPKKEL